METNSQKLTTPREGHRVPVWGHTAVLDLLLGVARRETPAQSYLLSGPPDIGKGSVARRFAQSLLCTGAAEERPCGLCRVCRLVAGNVYPDLHVSHEPLRVDSVREIQSQLALSPTEGRYRVVVLEDIDRASASAANAILKTLEEPPPHAVLVLTTAAAEDVLTTIRSRCQTLTLRPLTARDVADGLVQATSATPEDAELLGRLSSGRFTWALRAAADPTLLETRATWLTHLDAALGAGPLERLELAADLAGDAETVLAGLSYWRGWARDLMLACAGATDRTVNIDRDTELTAQVRRLSLDEATHLVGAIDTALARVDANVNRQLALEALLLELPG